MGPLETPGAIQGKDSMGVCPICLPLSLIPLVSLQSFSISWCQHHLWKSPAWWVKTISEEVFCVQQEPFCFSSFLFGLTLCLPGKSPFVCVCQLRLWDSHAPKDEDGPGLSLPLQESWVCLSCCPFLSLSLCPSTSSINVSSYSFLLQYYLHA